MADAVLAGQDEGVGEELLAAGADQLPLDVLDGNLGGDGGAPLGPSRQEA